MYTAEKTITNIKRAIEERGYSQKKVYSACNINENTVSRMNDSKLKRIKDAYLNGIDTIEEYKANKAKITAEIEKLKAKQKKPEPKPELETRRFEFIKLFDNGNAIPAELNAALKSFIAYIIYSRPDDSITLFLNP